MTNLPTQINVSELSLPERILLVQDIWDSIVAEQVTVGLSESQKAELGWRNIRTHPMMSFPGRMSKKVFEKSNES